MGCSTHTPVYANFNARVRRIDENMQTEVLESLVEGIEPDEETQNKLLDIVERRKTENSAAIQYARQTLGDDLRV